MPLTEYVPRERADKGGVEYANAAVMREGRSVIEVRFLWIAGLLLIQPVILSVSRLDFLATDQCTHS